jgi:NADH:ubiquinone oxidoreductase subunit C
MSIEKVVINIQGALKLDKSCTKLIPIGETVISISKHEILLAVRTILGSDIWHLSTITCQQLEKDFTLLYHFWKYGGLTLQIRLDEKNPQIESICKLIPGAEYYEKEAHEMFGIEFLGLPNPAPLLLPDNWQGGFPMRRKEPPSHNKPKG